MIVIEGKNKKAIKLENLIRKEFRTNSVAILDATGVEPFALIDGVTHHIIDHIESADEVINFFKERYFADFQKNDWIVFYIDADKSSIEKFIELDREFNNNFILTVQSQNGLTNLYYL